jgi:hypothetical protein
MAFRIVEVYALEATAGLAVLSLIKVPLRNFSGLKTFIRVDEVCPKLSQDEA